MSFPVRIAVAAINIVSLIITLLYPNSATPISVLPIIVGVTIWSFLHYNEYENSVKRWAKTIIIMTVIVISICCILFMICDIENSLFAIKKDVVFFSQKTFSYSWFAVPVFVLTIFLTIAEFNSYKYGLIKKPKSFDEYVDEIL